MKEKDRIESLELINYGMIKHFTCDSFSNINLIIGENGSGKTFLLKSMYSAIKSVEEYKRGDDIRSGSEILAEKLRWTFQAEKLGDIVTKSAPNPLSYHMVWNMGIQIFIASHSYFVIKKLYLLALKRKQSITCISLNQNSDAQINDLLEGTPTNSIINKSIRLYEEEISEML